jgi:hypothetical protein
MATVNRASGGQRVDAGDRHPLHPLQFQLSPRGSASSTSAWRMSCSLASLAQLGLRVSLGLIQQADIRVVHFQQPDREKILKERHVGRQANLQAAVFGVLERGVGIRRGLGARSDRLPNQGASD